MSEVLSNTDEWANAAAASSASLQVFCQVAEAVAATNSKLAKVALVGDYLQQLGDDDLARAARYFAGHQFASSDARTTNVGGSIISEALLKATGANEEELAPLYVRLGDAGEAAYELLEKQRRGSPEPVLTLANVESLFEALSETRGAKQRVGQLAATFQQSTALEAKYLIKLLVGDLRIGLKEALAEDAIARAFAQPLTSVARANMLLGDIGEMAVRARANDLKDVVMRLFHPLKFMLATAAVDLPDIERTMPEEFFVEDKFDGIRAQAHVRDERVAIYSRTMDEITHRFPELIEPLKRLSGDAIIDGEIVPARGQTILPFSDLQKRLGRKTVTKRLLSEVPVILVAYDLFYANGSVVIDRPLAERRRILERLVSTAGMLRLSSAKRLSSVSQIDAEFAAARARGNEGLMIKSPSSRYTPGKRGREWLKLKRALATLDVVVTAVEVGHGKRRHLLSDYTFAVRRSEQDHELLNIGRAYSGLTDKELAELTEWFRAHTIKEFAQGRVRIVQPQTVIEVTFDRVQKSQRHKSGYALRFPRIVRLRPDKLAAEIDTLATVSKLAEEG